MSAKKTTDLSAYKRTARPVAPVLTEENVARQGRASRTIGRPPKSKAEKRSEKITLSFTASEFAQIKEQAGLVPHATFLMKKLQEAGLFDS